MGTSRRWACRGRLAAEPRADRLAMPRSATTVGCAHAEVRVRLGSTGRTATACRRLRQCAEQHPPPAEHVRDGAIDGLLLVARGRDAADWKRNSVETNQPGAVGVRVPKPPWRHQWTRRSRTQKNKPMVTRRGHRQALGGGVRERLARARSACLRSYSARTSAAGSRVFPRCRRRAPPTCRTVSESTVGTGAGHHRDSPSAGQNRCVRRRLPCASRTPLTTPASSSLPRRCEIEATTTPRNGRIPVPPPTSLRSTWSPTSRTSAARARRYSSSRCAKSYSTGESQRPRRPQRRIRRRFGPGYRPAGRRVVQHHQVRVEDGRVGVAVLPRDTRRVREIARLAAAIASRSRRHCTSGPPGSRSESAEPPNGAGMMARSRCPGEAGLGRLSDVIGAPAPSSAGSTAGRCGSSNCRRAKAQYLLERLPGLCPSPRRSRPGGLDARRGWPPGSGSRRAPARRRGQIRQSHGGVRPPYRGDQPGGRAGVQGRCDSRQ
jgi:hypothetical protein